MVRAGPQTLRADFIFTSGGHMTLKIVARPRVNQVVGAALLGGFLAGAAMAGTSAERALQQQQVPGFAAAAAAGAPREALTDRLIVKYRDGSTLVTTQGGASGVGMAQQQRLRSLETAGQRFNARLTRVRSTAQNAEVMKLDRRMAESEVAALAREIAAADPSVEYAEPDRILKPMLVPNDTQYSQQWHYFEATGGLNLPPAWDKSTGSGVVVAVLDTGYRPHADLAANIVAGYDFINDSFVGNDGNGRDSDASDPGDAVQAGECGNGEPMQDETSSWHGTHVAGTIAAVTNNGTGVAGVAFGAKVQPLRVLGKCGGYTSDIADAIVWASGGSVSGVPANATPARVINLSLGGGGACDSTTQNAINSARSRNTVVVVAAGNSNANAANYSPASCSGVVTVAATNRSGGRAYYSNYGSVVEVAAPGGDVRSGASGGILSTLNAGQTAPAGDSYAWYQGTSMATPHVAGVVALMLAKNPALTPDQVLTRLQQSSRAFPATCSQCGSGIVDASAAVDAAGGGGGGGGTTVAETESNNTLSTAQAIANANTTVNGTIGSGSDTDYFRVTLPAGRTLAATLTPNSASDYDLYLYNANGTQLARSILGTGAVDKINYSNGGASSITLYVRVRYYSGRTGSTGTYTLGLGW
jgi:serine protease